jgi:hypothetical protein
MTAIQTGPGPAARGSGNTAAIFSVDSVFFFVNKAFCPVDGTWQAYTGVFPGIFCVWGGGGVIKYSIGSEKQTAALHGEVLTAKPTILSNTNINNRIRLYFFFVKESFIKFLHEDS